MKRIVTLDELSRNDLRLERRLRRLPVLTRDVLSLLRSALIRSQADAVDCAGSTLLDLSLSFNAHGLDLAGTAVTAQPWRPDWLDVSFLRSVDSASALCEQRQGLRSVTADTFYTALTKRETYRTEALRAAIRCAVVAGEGEVVTSVLPTGSGKTDVFLTAALHSRPRQSLLIVPTVSLALDLEIRIREMIGDSLPYAYVGNLSREAKSEFRRRLRDGSQWLTVTSPEAACTSLSTPLEDAAAAGRLAIIAIDEAHIVSEWGDDFRNEFQSFAGLRRRLLDKSPAGSGPATLMLTGTLDQHGFDTLTRLFAGKRHVLVAQQITRPEPEWWSAKCTDEQEKKQRLLEAVARLPRPLLVYTSLHTSERSTNVGDVVGWLRDAGYRAVAAVGGSDGLAKRNAALNGLRMTGQQADDLDIVVATSAFGLGVDVPDIRAVIHVCVPESVNRLYQEVGRSGRDGNATVALSLWTQVDEDLANEMSSAKMISASLAWKRWERLRLGTINGKTVSVDLSSAHDGVTYLFSDANRYWNVHTLLSMERVGMLQMQWPDPPEVTGDESEEDIAAKFAAQNMVATIRVLQGDLVSEQVFTERFERGRAQVRGANAASFQSAMTLLSAPNACIAELVAERYSFVDHERRSVPVDANCGGCPRCRKSPPKTPWTTIRSPHVSGNIHGGTVNLADQIAVSGQWCVYVHEPNELALATLLRRLVTRGIVRLITDDPTYTNSILPGGDKLFWRETSNSLLRDGFGGCLVPSIVFADSIADDVRLSSLLQLIEELPFAVIVTRDDRIDPDDDRLNLFERFVPHFEIETFLRRI